MADLRKKGEELLDLCKSHTDSIAEIKKLFNNLTEDEIRRLVNNCYDRVSES